MIQLDNITFKMQYEDKINKILSDTNTTAEDFYALKTFKDQIGRKGNTEFHMSEIVYHVELRDTNTNDIVKNFITSYSNKAEAKKKEFKKIAENDKNLKLVSYEKTVRIGDIYIIGEVINRDVTIEHFCNNIDKLNSLKIAYIIDDPDVGTEFKFDTFLECTSTIIMYKHFTTVEG